MFSTMIDFADMLLAALVVGAMFGVWLFFNPAGLAANIYVTMHQQGVRTLNKPMPVLGAAHHTPDHCSGCARMEQQCARRSARWGYSLLCSRRLNHEISESAD